MPWAQSRLRRSLPGAPVCYSSVVTLVGFFWLVATFPDGNAFLEANVGHVVVSHTWNILVPLFFWVWGAILLRAGSASNAILCGWICIAAISFGIFNWGTPGLVRWAVCALALPGWIVLDGFSAEIRQTPMGPGNRREWLFTIAMLPAALMLVVAGSSAYFLMCSPGLSLSARDSLAVFARTVFIAGLIFYPMAAATYLLIQSMAQKIHGPQIVLLSLGAAVVLAATAVILKALQPLDPNAMRAVNLAFAFAHLTPLVLMFCQSIIRAAQPLPVTLGTIGLVQWPGLDRIPGARPIVYVTCTILLLPVQIIAGRMHVLYGWGASTTVLYSSLAVLATGYLLTATGPRAGRLIVTGAALLPVFAFAISRVLPVRSRTWAAYLVHDRNANILREIYFHFVPDSDATSAALRRVLVESSRFVARGDRPARLQRLSRTPVARAPNVIFIVADGLRRLSYGESPGEESRYPGLAALRKMSVEYRNVWTSFNATTGSEPAFLGGDYGPAWYEKRSHVNSDNILARASDLAGYRLKNLANYGNLGEYWPAKAACDMPAGEGVGDPAVIFPAALSRLDSFLTESTSPVFVYLHLYNNHQPLIQRKGVPYDTRNRHWMLALYENNVAYMDRQLEGFLKGLEKRGLLDSTLLVFTADHGEELFEHGGLYHGWQINPEVMRPPLYIHYPSWAKGHTAGVDDRFVNLVDIAPTVTELMGVHVDRISVVQGINLLDAQALRPHSFPLTSWVTPLLGEVRDDPPVMYVQAARSGDRWTYKPTAGHWDLVLDENAGSSDPAQLIQAFDDIFTFHDPSSPHLFAKKNTE